MEEATAKEEDEVKGDKNVRGEGKKAKGEDKQSRDWMLTIPAGRHTEDDVAELLERICSGAVFQREKGEETDYEHFQCFLQIPSPMRWSTLKNHLAQSGFDDVHIEVREHSVESCVNYCSKDDTRIGETRYIGKIRMQDQQGKRTDLSDLREKILNGASVEDVLLEDTESKSARYVKWLSELAAARDKKKYGRQMRNVEVHYLWGAPGVGKTSYVYERYPIEDIYRVTDYQHPFDEYDRQPVLVLDEYDSQFDWEKLLCYLDRYPLMLPARYHNRQACYTTVWIISNKSLDEQYPLVQGERRLALTRRLSDVRHMGEARELIIPDCYFPKGVPEEVSHEHTGNGHSAGSDEPLALFKDIPVRSNQERPA
ncbi:hypothetical protein BAAM0499_07875 [Bifidobacterium animalis subsp. animalis MCC 0499]|uniref:hypothetical protein n=1 Tax=Bifidobacterium animalis TaxID=28025 RepID=UPI00069CA751|nr:hypothetical protein [Bifidobacterium animalis]KOA59063.1 hypothetical protein BAAM0499_07875 [Bifidobacterium animalis subsp. animalis MCC 0499]